MRARKQTRALIRESYLIETKNFVKTMLDEHGVTFAGLAAMLSERGYGITEAEVARWLGGGTCPLWFLLLVVDTLSLRVTFAKARG
jgi:hypothetical protein